MQLKIKFLKNKCPFKIFKRTFDIIVEYLISSDYLHTIKTLKIIGHR
ncbi:MAG: hypothetical protein ACJAX4_003970 [Clostridium sp.]|jgi:hypothetical protein